MPGIVNKSKNQLREIIENEDYKKMKTNTEKNFLNNLESNLEKELDINKDTISKIWGKKQEFYSTFQLLHLNSNKYLTFDEVSALNERENYRVYLSEFPFSRTNFSFEPSYKFQNQHLYVTYDDPVQIRASKIFSGKKPYLHTTIKNTEQLGINHDIDLLDDEKNQKNAQKDSNQESALESEINISQDNFTKWNVKAFSIGDEDATYLNYGDVVWLTHIELEAYLSVKKNEDDSMEFNFLKTVDINEYFLEYTLLSDSFDDKRYGNTNGMWILEAEAKKMGGFIEKGVPVRLKHMLCGLYLTLFNNIENHEPSFGLSDKPGSNNLFIVNPIYEDPIALKQEGGGKNKKNRFIKKDGFFEIKSYEDEYYMKCDRIVLEDKDNEVFVPFAEQNFTNNNIFRITLALSKDTIETQFIRSNIPKLKNHLFIVKLHIN